MLNVIMIILLQLYFCRQLAKCVNLQLWMHCLLIRVPLISKTLRALMNIVFQNFQMIDFGCAMCPIQYYCFVLSRILLWTMLRASNQCPLYQYNWYYQLHKFFTCFQSFLWILTILNVQKNFRNFKYGVSWSSACY